MKVNSEDLIEGCILLKDVSARAMQPMILADTVLTQQHIDFLNAFEIQHVEVKNTLKNGTVFQYEAKRPSRQTDGKGKSVLTFNVEFRKAVKTYQKLYKEWESGIPVQIMKIKELILPLIDLMQNDQYAIKAFQAINTCRERGAGAVITSSLSAFFARKQGMDEGDVLQLSIAGLLLDCGLAKLPEGIDNSKYQTEEFQKDYRQHPVHGYRMLKELKVIQEGVLLSVLQHHERIDGSGFPLKLNGIQLHPYAKMISIIDQYVTCCIEQAWLPRELPMKAFTFLQKEPAGKLEKTLMQAFIYEGMQLLIGQEVRLSNGEQGEVVFIPENTPAAPYVSLQNQTILNLHTEPAIWIEDLAAEKVYS